MNKRVIKEKFKNSLKIGISGGKAMSVNIIGLMWIRTIINYQYKYGTTFPQTFMILYKQGGIKRFYSGFTYALLEAPVFKFFDTFSNSIILDITSRINIPIFMKTMVSSIVASGVKIFLAPLDTFKTMHQVEGKNASIIIKQKINKYGIRSLYHGISASIIGGFIGHYPWFVSHNYLEILIPKAKNKKDNILRNAFIGFTASSVSNVTSNFIRVIKTSKQTAKENSSYIKVIENIRKNSGIKGLLFRGMGVRLILNGVNGLCFNVLWKYFQSQKIIKR